MTNGFSLSAQNVVKRYGGVVALSDGNLEVHSGEVVALVGANGSGKSTLTKIITGVVALDRGQLLLNGSPVTFTSPQAAKKHGITAVYQELSLVPQMTVGENIWLAHEPLRRSGRIDQRAVRRQTIELLDLFRGAFHADLDPDSLVSDLPADEKQIVEILKALSTQPKIMILDEATASLDSRQVQRLFELVQDWKKAGMAIAFVSHRMDEIFRLADRITVLRNGRTVGHAPAEAINERQVVELMVEGASASAAVHRERRPPETFAGIAPRLQIQNITTDTLKGLSCQAHPGELLGIGGLQGQGQRDLLLAIFGAIPYSGDIKLEGRNQRFTHPRQAMEADIALVPGERAKEGLLMIRSILDNFHLPNWRKYGAPIRMQAARRDAQEVSAELNLVMAGLDAPVNSLSGGNAQKVVIGKWLLRSPKILLLDDPTKGVDVGTKAEFYKLLDRLCTDNTTVLFYSSDDEELLGLCDRVIVLQDGSQRGELTGQALTRANLVALSMGATESRQAPDNLAAAPANAAAANAAAHDPAASPPSRSQE